MIKTFTQNDLIRYYYNEMSEEEKTEIENALVIDPNLMEEYREISTTARLINEVEVSPSERTISNILSYSKKINVNSVCNS
ncbi:hypothetical protein QQ008_23630 [Fulvivirgaceae bacterium BMA10]|uniref:Uncharacterized protein n=1 Tax=Splendidivirga corallicola TaxID=3051826 RepID=A0ABT8KW61_9BACT|nr:hypothetical protein [Fulvivirgaceae bacterium BMA10]